MKLQFAACFTGVACAVAALYTILFLLPGLELASVLLPRRAWMEVNRVTWAAGWWFWLLAIFSWMVLLVTLMWSYSPAHRITSMLQSGLMVIAAVLAIGGVTVWMAALPVVMADSISNSADLVALVDALALGLIGGGLLMGGVVTAWVGIDLARLNKLPWLWLAPGIAAGVCAVPSPFILPQPLLLLIALLCWIVWSIFLATRRTAPKAYAEWQGL